MHLLSSLHCTYARHAKRPTLIQSACPKDPPKESYGPRGAAGWAAILSDFKKWKKCQASEL